MAACEFGRDPCDCGPCYDLCMCSHCWFGWTRLSLWERIKGRIEYIIWEATQPTDPRNPCKEIKLAADCNPCPDCDEPFCDEHNMHYADCPCRGPHSEDDDE